MRAQALGATLLFAMSFAATGAAQDKDKDTAADDEVFDNTKLNEELAQKRAKARREKYQGDSPFAADKKPDKIEKREDRWSPGVQGGYRAGWAQPLGNSEQGERFTEDLTGMIFLWGDGGYQFIPHLMVGIYLSGGYVIPDCDGDISCSAWDFRAGVQAQFRIWPFGDFTPWVGVGSGWELFLANASTDLDELSSTSHGPELFFLQGGVDIWAPTARGHAGLFLAYSFGRFISVSVSRNGESIDNSDFEPDTHNWLFVGARGTF
jgi:hypothetical protein